MGPAFVRSAEGSRQWVGEVEPAMKPASYRRRNFIGILLSASLDVTSSFKKRCDDAESSERVLVYNDGSGKASMSRREGRDRLRVFMRFSGSGRPFILGFSFYKAMNLRQIESSDFFEFICHDGPIGSFADNCPRLSGTSLMNVDWSKSGRFKPGRSDYRRSHDTGHRPSGFMNPEKKEKKRNPTFSGQFTFPTKAHHTFAKTMRRPNELILIMSRS